MLTLTEELFLLSLYEKKDTVALPYTTALPYALAGAMLAELALAGAIYLDKEKRAHRADDAQPSADKRANELLAQISASPKPKKIAYWIMTEASKGRKLEKEILDDLIEQGVLKKEEKRVLWVIPYTDYSQEDASLKYLRKQHLRDIVLSGRPADPRSVALLSLMRAIDLLFHIFTIDEMKSASSLVKKIIEDEAVGAAVVEVLETISAAAIAAAFAAMSSV